jgi:hypothetical protein
MLNSEKIMNVICSRDNRFEHLPALKNYVKRAERLSPEFGDVFRRAYDAVESYPMVINGYESRGRDAEGFRQWIKFSFKY